MGFHTRTCNQHYRALGARLAVAFGLLFISRILLYVFNPALFPTLSMRHILWIALVGLRFDFSALCMVNGAVILWNILPFAFSRTNLARHITNCVFVLGNAMALLPNYVDVIYYRFTLKRTTGDIFRYLAVQNELPTLIPQFIKDFWYIFLLWIASIASLLWICRKVKPVANPEPCPRRILSGTAWLTFALVAVLTLIGIRGGLQMIPISILTASLYTTAKTVPLVLNTPFAIIKTITEQSLPSMDYFPSLAQAEAIYPVVHQFSKNPNPLLAGIVEKPNVVIIILEGFSQEHIGALNRNAAQDYPGFTPFLDSLIDQSLVCDGFANGKHSIEGIPAILSGLPTWMNQNFLTSVYAGNKFNSLASLLQEAGYSSAFYHGGRNGTIGLDAYARAAGFDHYYGRTEYANDADYDGCWGIWDEPFLQYFAQNLNHTPEPFVAVVFTLTSHHPFQIPAKYQAKFRTGKLKIQQSILYTDYALSQFFATAQKMPWFDRTLFVITADHTSEAWLPWYRTRPGSYAIPILFYRHNSALKGHLAMTVQQTDILPSVLDYLHFPAPFVAFGQSIFQTEAPHVAVTYLNHSWQLVRDGNSLEWDGEKTTSLYPASTGRRLSNNLAAPESPDQRRMEQYLKAIIQQYHHRMSANQLTVTDRSFNE